MCCMDRFVIATNSENCLRLILIAAAVSIIIIMIALSVKADAGRHSASFALGNYDTSFSGRRLRISV